MRGMKRSRALPRSPSQLISDSESNADSRDSEFLPKSSCSDEFHSDDENTIAPAPPARRSRKRICSPAESFSQLGSDNNLNIRCTFTEPEICQLRNCLLDWYVDNHRSLPWRAPPLHQKGGLFPLIRGVPSTPSSPGSPYAIWVSEIMSQQTRLSVVENYFTRWMIEFPNVHALAAAPLERVNEIWAGLGYYRRARFLHEGAKQVVFEYGGTVPDDVTKLQKLKGIGRYTAGAIASIAFGKKTPVVDGNIERVFARLCPGLSQGKTGAVPAAYWELAERLIQREKCPGDLNQALMELGATICKPKAVQCCLCPVQDLCGARNQAVHVGVQPAEYVTRFPYKDLRKKAKVRQERVAVLVICVQSVAGRKYLLVQRPSKGLLAGLWEAPNEIVCPDVRGGVEAAMENLSSVLPDVLQNKDLQMPFVPETRDPVSRKIVLDVGEITHLFSHIRQTMIVRLHLYRFRKTNIVHLPAGVLESSVPYRWLLEEELRSKAVPTQMRKVFAAASAKIPTSKPIR